MAPRRLTLSARLRRPARSGSRAWAGSWTGGPTATTALYIRADTGRWYHASLENACPRLVTRSNVRFLAAPNGDFDRYSTVVADGWRCQVAAVAESGGPPDYSRRHR